LRYLWSEAAVHAVRKTVSSNASIVAKLLQQGLGNSWAGLLVDAQVMTRMVEFGHVRLVGAHHIPEIAKQRRL
jgi:hypothetical protein